MENDNLMMKSLRYIGFFFVFCLGWWVGSFKLFTPEASILNSATEAAMIQSERKKQKQLLNQRQNAIDDKALKIQFEDQQDAQCDVLAVTGRKCQKISFETYKERLNGR